MLKCLIQQRIFFHFRLDLDKVDNIKKRFGERVRELRLSKNLTQEDLAYELGLEDSRQVRIIEKGEKFVNLKTVARLAIVLDVPLRVFFDFDL